MPKGIAARGPSKGSKPKAITADRVSLSGPMGREKSVSIRKIENGYIVQESTYGPKGYKSTERFEPKPPTVQVAPTKRR